MHFPSGRLLAAALAVALAPLAAALFPGAAHARKAALYGWKPGEAFGYIVERGPLGQPARQRDFLLVHAVRGESGRPELIVIAHDTRSGATTAAYRVELDGATRQPKRVEPVALRFDARNNAFGVKADGPELACDLPAESNTFSVLWVATSSGPSWLPVWHPGSNGETARHDVRGGLIDWSAPERKVRTLRQGSRRDDWGLLAVDVRTEDDGPPIIGSARFASGEPAPVWGEWLDGERREHIRFRLAYHVESLAQSLLMSRGPVSGDPLLFPPELILNAASEWKSGIRDLIAEEVLAGLRTEKRWRTLPPRESPSQGEVVGYAYELFSAMNGVKTGESAAKKAPEPAKSKVSPRGAIGAMFVGRVEAPDTAQRYEAWVLPGTDERAEEGEGAASTFESSGRLALRWVLGRATGNYLSDRPFAFYRGPGGFARARAKSPRGAEPAPTTTRRGSDALLLRREGDLAPVMLIFYRLADDLRSVVVFARIELDGSGSLSAVRRSQLERPKDFFLTGGFSAFSTKRGSGVLITRTPEDGTVVEHVPGRGCSVALLTERDLPEEPWKIAFDPKRASAMGWGTPTGFVTGRGQFGDARMPRQGILRRTDGEELIAFEEWEPDASWWSAAICVFPQQNLGARFRPLVHTPEEEIVIGDAEATEVIPFDPPPPPPQPQGNPKTLPPKARPTKPPKKADPDPKKPAPPPAPTGGPVTGGGK